MMRRAFRWIGLLTIIGLMVVGWGLIVLFWKTPSVDSLIQTDPPTTAFIDRAVESGLSVTWTPVSYDEISIDLKLAVVVSEDVGFFQHRGFDTFEIRAALKDAFAGKPLRGASTITQQLAKNLWLSQDRTLRRKLQEAVLAWKLERKLSKRRILELYLNTAVFGPGTFGVEAAAQRYFGISASGVTRDQAARLAATLPAPSYFYPGSGSPRAARQYQRILERMDWPTGLRKIL